MYRIFSHRAKLQSLSWLACTLALSMVGYGDIDRAMAQEAAKPQRHIVKAQPFDRNAKPDQHRVIVREPDGSLARSLRFVQKTTDIRQPNKLDLPALFAFDPTELTEGILELDLSNTGRICMLRSDAGFVALSAARLQRMNEIQLLKFGELSVNVLRQGKPAPGVAVRVSLTSTSDGLHNLRTIVCDTTTDENGIARISQLPPGALNVVLDHRAIEEQTIRGLIRGTTSRASRRVWVEAGQVTKLDFGKHTRTVTGQFEFPRGFNKRHAKFVSAQLFYQDQDASSVRLDINEDGKFTCSDAPVGNARMNVLGPVNLDYFQHTQLVEVREPDETGQAQDLGLIELKRSSNTQVLPISSGTASNNAASALTANASGRVAWIGLAETEGHRRLLMMNDRAGVISCDPALKLAYMTYRRTVIPDRDRLYTATQNDKGTQYFLTALDRSGKVIWQHQLTGTNPPIDMSFNNNTGTIWLLMNISSQGEPNLLVFNRAGECIQKLTNKAEQICSSEDEPVMWWSSKSKLVKLDVASYEELVQLDFSHEVQSMSLSATADGGIALVETCNSEWPASINQLTKVDRNGHITGKLDLGTYKAHSLVETDGYLLACGSTRSTARATPTENVLRIKQDFSEYEVIPTNLNSLRLLTSTETHVAVLANYRLALMNLAGDTFTITPADQTVNLLHAIAD